LDYEFSVADFDDILLEVPSIVDGTCVDPVMDSVEPAVDCHDVKDDDRIKPKQRKQIGVRWCKGSKEGARMSTPKPPRCRILHGPLCGDACHWIRDARDVIASRRASRRQQLQSPNPNPRIQKKISKRRCYVCKERGHEANSCKVQKRADTLPDKKGGMS